LPDGLHYLNCAYMAPLSRNVEAAGVAAIERLRVPSNITPEHFFDQSDELRTLFARLIHAESERIAILPSVSYGIATVAKNSEVQKGHNVVLAHEQFPSNVYGWRRLSQRTGCEIRTVRPPDAQSGRGRAWNERVLEAIDAETRVVALSHVHWADGTLFRLTEIGERARDVGAAFVIDGTQSVGALPFDVGQIQPDAVICAGYKWLLGPYGMGLAYFGTRFDDGVPLEENWITRYNSQSFSRLVEYEDRYQKGAVRFDMGERSSFVLTPMLVEALKQLLRWTPEGIQDYCRSLTRDLLVDAAEHGFVVEDEEWRGAHMFGIRTAGRAPVEVLHEALQREQVVVSVRGDAVRVSPHVYNDAADMRALADALASCVPAPAQGSVGK